MEEKTCGGMSGCGCVCHKSIPVLIILFGLVFLLGALDVMTAHSVSIAWPVIIMLVGFMKMCKGMGQCCK
ncbi:hypothetical protein HY061_03470 [Candidatus Azambacteria bacterium]|nr:hypothetical protein [Candidatus Azambacteria bacterium]